ncbi:hypothetical protein A374_00140 [Fictibacillus macauensis ZFHKF-1]|uniref:Uncharacterized protein n=1 Tax=Fictibacillus macauensis ZFHKF-1 TaxID=1196324 RepID=I8AN84_9BACL|nr:hypothetical protein A374_00140 [Fictibacillus macauensis ZFHKF-1]
MKTNDLTAYFLIVLNKMLIRLLQKTKSCYIKKKNDLWPMDYENVEELMKYMKENRYHYYKLYASYGLNGWVLSKGIRFDE